MGGSAQLQSVIALPAVDLTTQLISTAPPSIFTHPAPGRATPTTSAAAAKARIFNVSPKTGA